MTILEETKKMYKQLSKEYQQLSKRENIDYFELKSLEIELLKCEGQLRSLGEDL